MIPREDTPSASPGELTGAGTRKLKQKDYGQNILIHSTDHRRRAVPLRYRQRNRSPRLGTRHLVPRLSHVPGVHRPLVGVSAHRVQRAS